MPRREDDGSEALRSGMHSTSKFEKLLLLRFVHEMFIITRSMLVIVTKVAATGGFLVRATSAVPIVAVTIRTSAIEMCLVMLMVFIFDILLGPLIQL